MGIEDLVLKNRSYRRFHQDRPVGREVLVELVSLARLTPSSGNRQPLRYLLSADPETNSLIYSTLGWAVYLKDWPGPEEGERPGAYIVILGDTEVVREQTVDPGIVMQTMLLAAVEKGLGGCMFGSIRREELARKLELDSRYRIANVLALGYPKEEVVLEDCEENGDIRYYRDGEGRHHVPKLPLETLILK